MPLHRQGLLRSHLKTHRGEKSNQCNQCDYESSCESNFRRHLKIHTGEKSNKCNQCNYASSRIWQFEDSFENTQWRKVKQMQSVWLYILRGRQLEKTFEIHSGEKSNKCYQCNYASSCAGNLRRHLKTHSGEKSNKCNQYDYSSSQACTLRKIGDKGRDKMKVWKYKSEINRIADSCDKSGNLSLPLSPHPSKPPSSQTSILSKLNSFTQRFIPKDFISFSQVSRSGNIMIMYFCCKKL